MNGIMERYRKGEEELNEKFSELVELWIDRGHAALDEIYWNKWDEIVPIRINDLYKGMELEACLEIIEALNSGCTLEKAKVIIDAQNHSGMSFSLVCRMVYAFCERGEEFVDSLK